MLVILNGLLKVLLGINIVIIIIIIIIIIIMIMIITFFTKLFVTILNSKCMENK